MEYLMLIGSFFAGATAGWLGSYKFLNTLIKKSSPPKGSMIMVITPEGVPGVLKLQQLSETPDPARAIQKACELYSLLLQQQAMNDVEVILRTPNGEEQVISII